MAAESVVEPPLQGSHDFGIGAQDVALGWYRPRPWRFGMTEGQAFCHPDFRSCDYLKGLILTELSMTEVQAFCHERSAFILSAAG